MENDLELVTTLINRNQIEEALLICEKKNNLNNVEIQRERLYILTKITNNYDKAYYVWNDISHFSPNNTDIICKGIDILIHLGRLDEALELSYRNDDIKTVRMRVATLIKRKEYEKAKAVCLDSRFSDDSVITDLSTKIDMKTNKINDNVSLYLTRLYVDDLTVENIKNSELEDYSKNILLLAYYEKHNPKLGLRIVKDLKKTKDLANEYRKILNKIEQKLISKKEKFFDISDYGDLLNRRIDFDYALEYNEKKNKEKDNTTEVIVKKEEIIPKKEEVKEIVKKEEKKIVSITGNRVNNRYNTITNIDNTKSLANNREKVILINDVLREEIDELGKFLYIKMQDPESRKDAIIAWDNLDVIKNSPITDTKKLNKMIGIFERLNNDHPEIVKTDVKKLEKLRK